MPKKVCFRGSAPDRLLSKKSTYALGWLTASKGTKLHFLAVSVLPQ